MFIRWVLYQVGGPSRCMLEWVSVCAGAKKCSQSNDKFPWRRFTSLPLIHRHFVHGWMLTCGLCHIWSGSTSKLSTQHFNTSLVGRQPLAHNCFWMLNGDLYFWYNFVSGLLFLSFHHQLPSCSRLGCSNGTLDRPDITTIISPSELISPPPLHRLCKFVRCW